MQLTGAPPSQLSSIDWPRPRSPARGSVESTLFDLPGGDGRFAPRQVLAGRLVKRDVDLNRESRSISTASVQPMTISWSAALILREFSREGGAQDHAARLPDLSEAILHPHRAALQDSKLVYRTWAMATYLRASDVKGTSSMRLHRGLGITQKDGLISRPPHPRGVRRER